MQEKKKDLQNQPQTIKKMAIGTHISIITLNVNRLNKPTKRHKFDPCVGKNPWRRSCQPTPVFLSGESHGQRSLVGYSPRGCKELDMTEQLTVSLPFFFF